MKIVQTFFSKPLSSVQRNLLSPHHTGGWLSPCYFFIGWSLSFLYLRKYFQSVYLVSDDLGQKLLMEEIGLPYEKCSLLPECLTGYDSRLWALPKIYAYQCQSEPFLHIDGDVFIRTNLLKKFSTSQLVVQSIERNVAGCHDMLLQIFRNFSFIPPELKYPDDSGRITFINAGVLGGCDIVSIRQYADLAIKFVEANQHSLFHIEPVKFNVIFEQYLFYNMFAGRQPVSQILEDDTIDPLALHLPPELSPYVHLIGENKKNVFNCLLVSYYLKTEFPAYYNRVIAFCRKQYGDAMVDEHNKRFEPFYSHLAAIFEQITDCTLEELLNLRFRLTTGYDKNTSPVVNNTNRSQNEVRTWQHLLPFFRTGNTGNDLLHQFNVDPFNNALIERIKWQIADLLMTNLVKEHNLEII